MITDEFNEFIQNINNQDKIACLDIGTKKIGVATSDKSKIIANPHSIIKVHNLDEAIKSLNILFDELSLLNIVVGWPVMVNGDITPLCQDIIKILESLLKLNPKYNFYLFNECFSTRIIDKDLKSLGLKRKKRNSIDDKIVACYLLQEVLNKI